MRLPVKLRCFSVFLAFFFIDAGNKKKGKVKIAIKIPSAMKPNHHAPTHLGSFLAMLGFNDGSSYKLSENDEMK